MVVGADMVYERGQSASARACSVDSMVLEPPSRSDVIRYAVFIYLRVLRNCKGCVFLRSVILFFFAVISNLNIVRQSEYAVTAENSQLVGVFVQ